MSTVRVGLVFALFAIVAHHSANASDAPTIEALAKDLKSKDAKVRLQAAEELGKFGPKAADYAKELCDALLDANPMVAKAALKALGRVRPDLHKPLTQSPDGAPQMRADGAKSLGALGIEAEPAAFVLVKSVAAAIAKEKRTNGVGSAEAEMFAALLKIGSKRRR